MSTVTAPSAGAPARSIRASAPSPFTRSVVAPRVSKRPLTPTAAECSVAALIRGAPATSSTMRACPQACPAVPQRSTSGDADQDA